MKTIVSTLALGAALLAGAPAMAAAATPAKVAAVPTAAEADKFIADAEAELRAFSLYGSRIAWVNATYITDDTDWLASKVGAEGTEMAVRLAKKAATFNNTPGLSYDTRRQLDGLKLGLTLPAPDRPTMPKTSPCTTESETPSSASVPPAAKRLWSSLRTMAAGRSEERAKGRASGGVLEGSVMPPSIWTQRPVP